MKIITTLEEFQKLVKANANVIIKFSAKWCGPCKTIQPFFAGLESQYPDIVFATCDCDDCPDVSDMCSIQSLPTFVRFKNGKQTESVIGISKSQISNLL